MMRDVNERWKTWDNEKDYGQVLYKRAIGELPEMESSKAAAKILKDDIRDGDSVLDVGCGSGHYLRSYKREIRTPFSYTGFDATQNYIDLANKAFSGQKEASFEVGDIYDIGHEDRSFDIVVSNNVLLHLPSIKKPVEELCRVAKRSVIIRMLVGSRSFIIKESSVQGDEFHDNGDPRFFNFYNIYSKEYISYLLSGIKRVQTFSISEDTQFDLKRIQGSVAEHKGAYDVTTVMGKWQVNEYILQPWAFVKINLKG